MAGPAVVFTEVGRSKLARVIGLSHWICILLSLFCLISALVIQLSVEDKISFIENYNGATLPGILVFTGAYGFFLHVVGGKVAFSNSRQERREKWLVYLLPISIATFFLFVFELTCGILSLIHINELEEAFDKGIRSSMIKYKTDLTVKEEMDVLQLSMQCCGSRSYKDWFAVAWIHPDYIEKTLNNKYSEKTDEVPFSCCDPFVMRPCIFTDVHENSRHYNYDYRRTLTLFTRGCTDILVDFYKDSVLTVIGVIVLLLSFIQLTLSIGTRFLQTALKSSVDSGNKFGPSIGYLLTSPVIQDDDEDETMSTGITEDEQLIDTTIESEDARYVSAQYDESPFYENVPPFASADTPDVTESQVEEYLSSRFHKSMDTFENPPPGSLNDHQEFETMNGYIPHDPYHLHKPPTLTEIRSNHGSYMAMNMSNSSKNKPYVRISSSPKIYQHPFPSPVRFDKAGGNTLVIDFNHRQSEIEQTSSSTKKSSRRPKSSERREGNLESPRVFDDYHKPRPQRFLVASPRLIPGNMSNHAHYLAASRPDMGRPFSLVPETNRIPSGQTVSHSSQSVSPIRRRSPVKSATGLYSPLPIKKNNRRSPNKYMTSSPMKTVFKPGGSQDCNHGFE